MKAIGKNIIVEIIDNTKKGAFDDGGYAEGYSDYCKQPFPNRGRVVSSSGKFNTEDDLIFYEMGGIRCGRYIVIKPESVFLRNGFLQKRGVIVEKHSVSQGDDSFTIRTQEYFKVIDSSIPEIQDGNLVVIRPRMCHRFNYNDREFFFVADNAIMFYVNQDQILPGPCYEIAKQSNDSPDYFQITSQVKKNSGIVSSQDVIFFDEQVCKVLIDENYYYIVPKNSVYGRDYKQKRTS